MTPVQDLELPPLDSVLASLADYVSIPSDSRDADPGTMRRAAGWIAAQRWLRDHVVGRVPGGRHDPQ